MQAPVQVSQMQSCNETHLAAQLCQTSLIAHSCLSEKHFAVAMAPALGASNLLACVERSVSEQHNS